MSCAMRKARRWGVVPSRTSRRAAAIADAVAGAVPPRLPSRANVAPPLLSPAWKKKRLGNSNCSQGAFYGRPWKEKRLGNSFGRPRRAPSRSEILTHLSDLGILVSDGGAAAPPLRMCVPELFPRRFFRQSVEENPLREQFEFPKRFFFHGQGGRVPKADFFPWAGTREFPKPFFFHGQGAGDAGGGRRRWRARCERHAMRKARKLQVECAMREARHEERRGSCERRA